MRSKGFDKRSRLFYFEKKRRTSVRPCPCGCHFRHRHGFLERWVIGGRESVRIKVIRLRCPQCGKTESVLPDFIRRRHQYPWPVRENLILEYLSSPVSYRRTASKVDGLSYQNLWGWVNRLASKARSGPCPELSGSLHGRRPPPDRVLNRSRRPWRRFFSFSGRFTPQSLCL